MHRNRLRQQWPGNKEDVKGERRPVDQFLISARQAGAFYPMPLKMKKALTRHPLLFLKVYSFIFLRFAPTEVHCSLSKH